MCMDCHMNDGEKVYVYPEYTDKDLRKMLAERRAKKKKDRIVDKHNRKIQALINTLKKKLK